MSGTVTCDNLILRNTGNFDISSQQIAGAGAHGTWRPHPGISSVTLSGTGVWLVNGYWGTASSGSTINIQFCVASATDISGTTGARQTAVPISRSILYYLSMVYGSSATLVDSIPISYTITSAGTYYFFVGGYPNGAAYRLTLTKIS